MAENIDMENIYVLGEKIEGLRSFEEMIEDARSRATVLFFPAPSRKIPFPTSCSQVEQLNSLKVDEMNFVYFRHSLLLQAVMIMRIVEC